MPALIGIWTAVGGAIAALAGLAGFLRVRRLRSSGVKAWAVAVQQPAAGDDEPDRQRRPLLQYPLADGRVLETLAPQAARKVPLHPGQSVLVWYDPADPLDILVYGRRGWASDLAFVIAGVVFIVAGAGIAIGG